MTMWRLTLMAAALISSLSMGGTLASAQINESAAAPGSVRNETVLTIHAKVVNVDEAKKLVTIETNGKKVDLEVQNPYNLKAVKVGDPIVVRYYEVVSIRKKNPGEEVPAASLSEGLATAHSGTPGATVTERVSLLVTVVDVDPKDGMVTIKGPDGSVEKVKARDPGNLKYIKAGDDLVVSEFQATAISVDKEASN